MGWDEKNERIAVFQDTMALCRENEHLRTAIQKSVVGQQVIREDTEIPVSRKELFAEKAEIIVSKKKSFEASAAYKAQKVCVLNFASATNPGGGVRRGSSAQEECLCRCSTLYPCISEKKAKAEFHDRHRNMLSYGEMDALYNDDIIYTPEVVIFKSDTAVPQTMPEEEWYSADVITCAAPNLRERPAIMNPEPRNKVIKISDDKLKEIHARRAGRILDVAKANGADVVILGAFGCGAFQNPAPVVAAGIREAVKQHRKDFRMIEFAIYCSARDTANYTAFKECFKNI